MEFYIIGSIIWGIVWGITARAVIINKGYYDQGAKWFWLGFFFSFIAVIIAATKPTYHRKSEVASESWKKEQEQKLLQDGGWKCTCGRINAAYVYSCACGKSKGDVINQKAQQIVETSPDETKQEAATAIREYKALLDEGIITQEEFDAKKKQLLGL